MLKKNFGYSLKNIPIPPKNSYQKLLISKVDSLIHRLRWRAYFFENPNTRARVTNNYGFKSENTPPQNNALIPFENGLIDLISNLSYTKHRTEFQNKLNKDVKSINTSKDMFVVADKTTNIYTMPSTEYNKLLTNNITKDYKKTDARTKRSIDLEAKEIAESLDLADRIECYAERQAFITLKDHKDNFENNPKCRLLNPAKSEIGSISKQHLQKINHNIRDKLNLNQWRDTPTVIKWFNGIPDKHQHSFLQFDIVDFYPSISQRTLTNALRWASTLTNIDESTKEIIMHSRDSLLFSPDGIWSKKNTTSLFDVTMGSYDGAEICELIGLLILHQLKERFPQIEFGLYRDDGLGCHKSSLRGPELERLKKQIVNFFKLIEFDITIDTNMTQVNFLDVTFCLQTGKHRPYRKPNDSPLYINKHSNHPPTIVKHLPMMIERRISDLSSDISEFDNTKMDYQTALDHSGFNHNLSYQPPQPRSAKRQRKRDVIWFNPPYNSSVTTNIGRKFLDLVDTHFPHNHKFHKIFNSHTIKVSYSTSPNMKSIITGHNKKILKSNQDAPPPTCNCRSKTKCPLEGKCQQGAIVYKASVSSDNSNSTLTRTDAVYIGGTENFKVRHSDHKADFNNRARKHRTKLALHIWTLKDYKVPHSIKWEVQARASQYTSGSRSCDLCLTEKLHILETHKKFPNLTLNKRSEIANKCRHRAKFKLENV